MKAKVKKVIDNITKVPETEKEIEELANALYLAQEDVNES